MSPALATANPNVSAEASPVSVVGAGTEGDLGAFGRKVWVTGEQKRDRKAHRGPHRVLGAASAGSMTTGLHEPSRRPDELARLTTRFRVAGEGTRRKPAASPTVGGNATTVPGSRRAVRRGRTVGRQAPGLTQFVRDERNCNSQVSAIIRPPHEPQEGARPLLQMP